MSNPEELPLAQNFARGLDVYTRLQSIAVDEVRPALQPLPPRSHLRCRLPWMDGHPRFTYKCPIPADRRLTVAP